MIEYFVIIFQGLVFMLLLVPLCIIQLIIFIFGGWTMDKYTRPNVIFAAMDWLHLT